MTETAVVPAQNADVEKQLLAKIEGIRIVEVVDSETFEQASANVKAMTEAEKSWTAYWAPLKAGAHNVWKTIVGKEKGPLDAIADKKESQRASAKKWADAEEAKRREAQRIADEKARKEAEDAQIAAAAELEAQGDKTGAESVLSAPAPVAAPTVRSSVPQGHGGMTQKYYSAEVFDVKALCRAVLEGKVPAQAVKGDEVFLNAQARMLKDSMNWPGVRVKVR